MRLNRDVKSKVLRIVAIIIAVVILGLFFLRISVDYDDLNNEQGMIKRHQKLQNETTDEMQKRIAALEETVVLQSKVIIEMKQQQNSVELNQPVPQTESEPAPNEDKVDTKEVNHGKTFWPVALLGTLEVFRTMVNPMPKILSPR